MPGEPEPVVDHTLNFSYFDMNFNETAIPIVRMFGATSYAVFCLFSIIMNSLLMGILLRGWKEYKKHAFYVIIFQHIICDILSVIVQFILSVPITYAGYNLYGSDLFLNIVGFFDTLGYYGDVHFAFLMTVNRFTVFILPKVNRIFFEKKLYWVTLAAWIYVISIVISVYFVVWCLKSFSTTGFYLYNSCSNNRTPFTIVFRAFQNFSLTYLPVAMLVGYVAIYIYIKLTLRNNMHGSVKRDFNILIQCFLICVALECENQTFSLFPYLPVSGQWKFMVNFLQNWIVILNNTINPIVLFIFNAEIKRSLKKLYRGSLSFSSQVQVQPTRGNNRGKSTTNQDSLK